MVRHNQHPEVISRPGAELADDHANARRLAEAIAGMPGASVDPVSVETNIVYFDVDPKIGTAKEVCARLLAEKVWMLDFGPSRLRAVTSLEVTREGIDLAIDALARVLATNSA